MPRQPEGKLVAATRSLLRSKGARPFKIQGDSDNFQEVGIPDILCCYRGWFVGLEAKMPGNTATAKQNAVLDEIAEADGYAIVFTTVEQVASLLAKIDQEVDLAFVRSHSSRRYDGTRAIRKFSKR